MQPDDQQLLHEIVDDYSELRSHLLNQFSELNDAKYLQIKNNNFASQQLTVQPILNLALDRPTLSKLLKLLHSAKFPLAGAYLRLEGTITKPLDAFPPAFYVPEYRLGFVFRTADVRGFDPEYLEEYYRAQIVHELAHSCSGFAGQLEVNMDKQKSKFTNINFGLGNDTRKTYLEKELTVDFDNHVWFDEAFAVYMVGQARKSLSSEHGGETFKDYGVYGDIDLHFFEHYVIRSGTRIGTVGGAVAGQTLELLVEKYPVILSDLMQVAKGVLTAREFRKKVKSLVTTRIYTLMFGRQPYTHWKEIYDYVEQMV